ncbi:MAG TPA: glycine zipper 2TM domain-containing protein [Rhodanobacteraceae bacterium]|nr:glycine zipper 2TM domain-containing protein [Rhodanobacteraceae bacterium]
MNHSSKHGFVRKLFVVFALASFATLLLSGCEPYPASTTRYSGGPAYGYPPPPPPPPPPVNAYQSTGVVRDIRQVYVGGDNNNAAIGTVIGAVVGGALGNQIGKGNGRTAATIGGAVAGGFAGHAIGSHSGDQGNAWQIVVQLDDGRYATVTQREPPNVQIGDYVVVANDHVYLRDR